MLDVACNHKFASVQIFLSSIWAFATTFTKVKETENTFNFIEMKYI